MRKIDYSVYLEHILDAIQQIEKYICDIDYEMFCQERMIHDAVLREMENVGEASRNLTKHFHEQYSEVSWSEIIGIRNKIAHQYFAIDLRIIWDTVNTDLPMLKKQVSAILNDIK